MQLYIINLLLFTILVMSALANTEFSCLQKSSCSSCIRTLGCVWCSTSSSDTNLTRCNSNTYTNNWCKPDDIINLRSIHKILKKDRVRGEIKGGDAIQITPQHIELSLRINEEKEVKMFYQQAKDYPIDLYFLMDLSWSMSDDRDSLVTMTDNLVKIMKALTNNLRIGFGSFVEKPMDPFTSKRYILECKYPTVTSCILPNTFLNHVPLTNDTNIFKKKVNESSAFYNTDSIEGGFDGLMQALVCTQQVGWRDKARKMIIYISDNSFHIGGDGKLGGIIEPNDETCHLDSDGFYYTESRSYDYPTISQIDKQAKKHNINIIFTATSFYLDHYKLLSNHIQGATWGEIMGKSSNIIDIISMEYKKLQNSIKLMHEASNFIKIQYFTKCTGIETVQTNECHSVSGRPMIEFTIKITALDCPKNRKDWNQKIKISPIGLNESLIIDLSILCDCPCERDASSLNKSPICGNKGRLQCGICSCDEGRYGRMCECDGIEETSSNDVSRCVFGNSQIPCSGLGHCRCGKCDCFKRNDPEELIYGSFCECDNFSCERNGGLLCSGSDKGRCDCGNCICKSGWSGIACECRESNATCINPESYELCSGNGKCLCGGCQCFTTDKFRYSGTYCQECPHCSSNRCDELRSCVECQVHGSGLYNTSECLIKCTTFQTIIIDQINITSEVEGINDEIICRVPDDAGCTIVYKYKYEDNNVNLRIEGQNRKECPKEIDYTDILLTVGGSIVLIGIASLIAWKIFTSINDRMEYVKFQKNLENAKFDTDNPLYDPPVMKYKNLMYRSSMRSSMRR